MVAGSCNVTERLLHFYFSVSFIFILNYPKIHQDIMTMKQFSNNNLLIDGRHHYLPVTTQLSTVPRRGERGED